MQTIQIIIAGLYGSLHESSYTRLAVDIALNGALVLVRNPANFGLAVQYNRQWTEPGAISQSRRLSS